MKASSGAQALETDQTAQAARPPVALFLVDERMPDMTGTQFLVEAIKLYPDARRVLLTAYADTETAITAINQIGLDHYLLKPWEPPSERLYPVLDDLLSDWFARARRRSTAFASPARALSPASYAVKDFLSREPGPVPVGRRRERRGGARARGDAGTGCASCRSCSSPTGTSMVQPTTRELAERLGMQTRANRAVLRSRRRRRRTGRTRRRGVRRVGGSAHDSRRAQRPRRTGGHELEDRELSRLPERRERRRSRAARDDAGEALRRRDPHGAGRRVAIGRDDPYRTVTFSDGSELQATRC